MEYNTLSAEFHLPCGHTLCFTYRVKVTSRPDDYNRQPENFGAQLYSGVHQLDSWLLGRAERHTCELVTEDNPHGLPRMS